MTFLLDDVTRVDGGVWYLTPSWCCCSGPGACARTADLDSTLPWLRADARERLFTELRKLDPVHPWLERA